MAQPETVARAGTVNVPLRCGYKASAEQFGPIELLELASLAESVGFDTIAVSDHFQPWRHHGGHAPASLPLLGALGERLKTARLGTSVLTPTMRYHPATIAQAFATLACLSPRRVFLGVGTGEAMNETPATARDWPGAKERRLRLAEAIALIRRLWTEERVSFEGEYYRTDTATIYDRPETPVPILVAASAPLAAKLAGRVGDGFICTSGKRKELYDELLSAVEEGARSANRDPAAIERFIEIKVSYDRDLDRARKDCGWWAALSLTSDEKSGIQDPLELERLAEENIERAPSRFIVADDPDDCADRIAEYYRMGFRTLVFHAPGNDQARFLKSFAPEVLPRLRELASVAA
jgi:coenzyme F420-dependent glucose-6-phosphate dehydrogenase